MLLQQSPSKSPSQAHLLGLFMPQAGKPLAKITVSYVREPANPAEIFPAIYASSVKMPAVCAAQAAGLLEITGNRCED